MAPQAMASFRRRLPSTYMTSYVSWIVSMIPCGRRLLLQEGSHLAGFFGDAASACLYSLQLSGACDDDNALVKDRGHGTMALL